MAKKIFLGPYLKFFLLPILTLVLFFSCLHASQRVNAEPEGIKKGLIWHAEHGDKSIYLLGSIHILNKQAYPLAETIENAYSKCNALVFETDLGRAQDPAIQSLTMQIGLLPEGKTLKGILSQETYEAFKTRIEKLGMPVSQLNSFKPWFAAIALIGLEFENLGFDPSYGIDSHFFQRAKQDNKELVYFESMEKQLRLLGEMDEEDQELFLKQTLKDLEIVEHMTSEILASWEAGDAQRLSSVIHMSFKNYPHIYDRLIVQRNREWKKRIVEFGKKNSNIMIIVGAGHLIGKDNLIEMLAEEGFAFKQQ